MSDGVLSGSDWHRLINSVWSTLYPLLLGIVRRIFTISAGGEIAVRHVLNVGNNDKHREWMRLGSTQYWAWRPNRA